MEKLSSIIIAKNEEKNIARCIESQSGLIDDIVLIIDSTGTDSTETIAKNFSGVTVIKKEWLGYSKTKQFAVSQTKHNWVFWIDADEVLTNELKQSIKSLNLEESPHKAYKMPRIANFLGRWIKHSGWYPGYVTRLFNKNNAQFSDKDVHEDLIIEGSTGKLTGDIEHYTDPDIFHYYDKFNKYTSLAAGELNAKGKSFGIADILIRPVYLFIKMYIIRAGFLDGLQGFMLAVFSANYVFTKYCKLWELKRKK